MIALGRVDFGKGGGLVTVVVQDAVTGAVLMVAHADRTALERTLESGELHLTSRRRGAWKKGETSGNVMRVVSLATDCDGDAVLARVRAAGPACHTGDRSCFGEAAAADMLGELDETIRSRVAHPVAGSYTTALLTDRNRRLKKLGEEAAELVAACADGDAGRATAEGADMVYHLLVALRAVGAGWDDVRALLAERRARPE